MILAVLVIAHNYRIIDRDLSNAVLSRRASLSYLSITALAEKFSRLSDVAVSLATRVRFRALVAEGKWSDAIEILKDVPRDLPMVERAFIVSPDGVLMADVPALPGVRGGNFSSRDWYRGVMLANGPYVSNVYKRSAEPRLNVIAVATPIRDEQQRTVGILVLQVSLTAFFDWVSGINVGDQGFVYIVDRNGIVAYHPRIPPEAEPVDYSSVPAVAAIKQQRMGVEVLYNPLEDQRLLSAYRPMPQYGWGVVVAQPEHIAFATRNALLNSMLVAYAVVFVMLLIFVYLVSRILIQRNEALHERALSVELERRVAERTQQLEASNKELESFSYSVSHDLRTPLRAIDGFSLILQEDHSAVLNDEARRLLGVVRGNTQQMAQLIDDLLAFSKMGRQPVASEPVDMANVVREVVERLKEISTRSIDWRVGDLPDAKGDRALLRQVWANLVGNAVKFSTVKATAVVTIDGRVDGNEVIYRVTDNGVGFNMQYYNKLFGVFQRLHNSDEFPGTGVGLAIVQRIVARHGGRVWAESKEGEGATFYFTLPAAGK